MQVLITGGPGSGATTTGESLANRLGIPVFDSDNFFHKTTNPPFAEQYSKEERNLRVVEACQSHDSWILSGSVCSWGVTELQFTHAVFLDVGNALRMRRLNARERQRFGNRIDIGGDMHEENVGFMKWATSYETGSLSERSLSLERRFVSQYCAQLLEVHEEHSVDDLVDSIVKYLGMPHKRSLVIGR